MAGIRITDSLERLGLGEDLARRFFQGSSVAVGCAKVIVPLARDDLGVEI